MMILPLVFYHLLPLILPFGIIGMAYNPPDDVAGAMCVAFVAPWRCSAAEDALKFFILVVIFCFGWPSCKLFSGGPVASC